MNIDKEKDVEKAIDGFTNLMSALGWNVIQEKKTDNNKLDKDIEIVKKFIEETQEAYSETLVDGKVYRIENIPLEFKPTKELANSISRILSELSNLKWKNEIYVKSIKSHKETIENKDKELEIYKDKSIELATNIDALKTDLKEEKEETETWKKIAEKLAEECTMFKKIQEIDLDNEYSNGLVYMTKEEVLDWAKREVLKDE